MMPSVEGMGGGLNKMCAPRVAELRGALSEKLRAHIDSPEESSYLKAFIFLDRRLSAAARKLRGGARRQRGETIARTLARRFRSAWAGSWSTLWEESKVAT